MVRSLFVFVFFMLAQTFGFGQEMVRYLNARQVMFDSLRDTVPSFYVIERESGKKERSKTYTIDGALVKDATSVKDANGETLFLTNLEYYPSGKLKRKFDFDGRTKIYDWKYYYENGKFRTDQKF